MVEPHDLGARAAVERADIPALKPLYSYAWFVGFLAAGLLYWGLSARVRSARVAEAVPRPSGAD